MNQMQYIFVAQEIQKRMQSIENKNPNYEKSKTWQKYKRQEEQLYRKLKQIQQEKESENGNQPNC